MREKKHTQKTAINAKKNLSVHAFCFFNTLFYHRIGPFVKSVCVSVCLSPFHLLDFEAYFAPTFQSRMSKNF